MLPVAGWSGLALVGAAVTRAGEGQAVWSWPAYVDTLAAEAVRAAVAVAAANPGHRFYAIALHGVDAGEDLLSLPLVGLASEEAYAADHPGDPDRSFAGPRYTPANFRWEELPLADAGLLPLERALTAHASDRLDATMARQVRAHVEVCERLLDALPGAIPVTDDFVAYVYDPAAGLELVRETVPAERFARLFPEQAALEAARAAVERADLDRRVTTLLDALAGGGVIGWEEALARLVDEGAPAVPLLAAALADRPDERWVIARALGRIGPTRAAAAIPALRAHATDDARGGNWCAYARAFLGDTDALFAEASAGSRVAAGALCVTCRAFADEVVEASGEDVPVRLDLLDALPATTEPWLQDELRPGVDVRHRVTPADVAAALRGLRGRRAAVRWTAASLLGDLPLKKKDARPVLDALLPLLDDRSAQVRRLVILALQRHKRCLVPSDRAAMAACSDDADATVRAVAAWAATA